MTINNHFRVLLTGLVAWYLTCPAIAAPVTGSDAIISPPVGKGVLPGSGVTASDFKSSILFSKIIPFLIDWTINLAMGLSVIMIIIGGYQYLTAYGNDEQRQQGTRSLYYALIGLAVALTAYGIVAIVTSIRIS
jgi:hypothetical protein